MKAKLIPVQKSASDPAQWGWAFGKILVLLGNSCCDRPKGEIYIGAGMKLDLHTGEVYQNAK